MTLKQLKMIFQESYYLPDTDIITAVSGAILANKLRDEPVWLVIIGPPGSLKTEIVSAAARGEGCRLLNFITEKTLISGFGRGKRNESLLPKLTEAGITTLINLDMSNIFSMRHEKRQEMMSQFRQIYDGQMSSDYGTGESISWEGFLGFIGCSTQEIDLHHKAIVQLGDRFLFFRMPPFDQKLVARAVLKNSGKRSKIRERVRNAFKDFLDNTPVEEVELKEESMVELETLSIETTRLRTPVSWSKGRKDISFVYDTESCSRFLATLKALLAGIVSARGEDIPEEYKVSMADFMLLRKIVKDSTPPGRREIMRAVDSGIQKNRYIARFLNISEAAAHYRLRELEALGILKQNGGKSWVKHIIS